MSTDAAIYSDADLPEHLRRIASRDYVGVNEGFHILIDAAAAIDRLATALEAARADGEWLEIESAPKDGTRALVWIEVRDASARSYQDIACFDEMHGRWTHGHTGPAYNPQPTHWRPLPSPPAEEKKT